MLSAQKLQCHMILFGCHPGELGQLQNDEDKRVNSTEEYTYKVLYMAYGYAERHLHKIIITVKLLR
jgi:hypothetical protein